VASPLESFAVGAGQSLVQAQQNLIRVLSVIPQSAVANCFPRVQRQLAALRGAGILNECFLLTSRTSPRLVLGEWRRLRKTINAFQPDLVHAQFGTVTAFLTVLSTTRPIIVTYRGSDLNPYKGGSRIRQKVARLLSQLAALRAARIVCVSEQLKQRLWWRKKRVAVIPNGVDLDVFHPRPRTVAREELGWEQREQVVLFNAGVDPISKRLDLAESSVAVAREICGDVRLHVLDGSTPPEMIPLLMNAADCLLLTSDWEGSPNVVKEAIACNLPVVSVEVGDVRERLAGVQPSRIVLRNPSDIGNGIAGILNLGERSNGRIATGDLTVEKISEQLAQIYKAADRL
jgi:teichuronic acid biosynthesis glycosyltransferase TuaC